MLVPIVSSLLISVALAAGAQPFAQPGDVIVSGGLYLPDRTLARLDPKALTHQEFLPGFSTPIAFDAAGNLIVFENHTVVRLNLETGARSPIYTGSYPSSVPVSIEDFLLLEDDSILITKGAGLSSKLWKLDSSTQAPVLVMNNPSCLVHCTNFMPRGMAHAGPGEIYLAFHQRYYTDEGVIGRLNIDIQEFEIVARRGLLDSPWFIHVDTNGSLLVGVSNGFVRVDPETGGQEWAFQGDMPYHFDIGTNGRLYFTHLSGPHHKQVSEVDPATGIQRVIGRGLNFDPRRIAVVPGQPAPPACSDGVDNDGDGSRDWPRDIGCTRPDDGTEETDCADGWDNDGDGLVDAGEDDGCRDEGVFSQENPACSDGVDNDYDGFTDHGQDPECLSASDNTEHWAPRFAGREPLPSCGLLGIELLPLALLPRLGRRRGRSRAANPI